MTNNFNFKFSVFILLYFLLCFSESLSLIVTMSKQLSNESVKAFFGKWREEVGMNVHVSDSGWPFFYDFLIFLLIFLLLYFN